MPYTSQVLASKHLLITPELRIALPLIKTKLYFQKTFLFLAQNQILFFTNPLISSPIFQHGISYANLLTLITMC
jgi:hypothetical protein